MQGMAIRPQAAIRSTPRKLQGIWFACLLVIYCYLYLLICLGAPFTAFDHENYINFLDDPFPFFFEPAYTTIAYLANWTLSESQRFPAVFILFTLPPLLFVWRHSRRNEAHPASILAFACVVTKSFYIGFIAQRFFFAELWVAAILITAAPNPPRFLWQLIPGSVHFSALTLIPTIQWMQARFSWRKWTAAFLVILGAYAYIRFISGFQFFGFSYARYLDSSDATDGFPFMSFIQMLILASICWYVAGPKQRMNLVGLCALTFTIKLLFSDIEVFSRIIQLQTDIIIVMAALTSRRTPSLLFAYCLGFMFLQVFLTSTSAEMAINHTLVILNVWQSI